MHNKTLPIILLTLVTLLQVSPAPLLALSLGSGDLIPASIPAGIKPIPSLQEADLDGNGIPETLALTGGFLTIFSSREVAWESPPD